MIEKVEDMLLPNAVVQRIIKDALPDGINVGKEARQEISKAASIFVLYLTSVARTQLPQKTKTLNPAAVISALEKMEMEHFVEPLKAAMEQYKLQQKNKKDKKQLDQPSTSTATSTETPTGEGDEEEIEDLPDTEIPEEMLLDEETEPIDEDTELPEEETEQPPTETQLNHVIH